MSYLAFALKYRPQNFEEVIGQDHIVASLKKAIVKNRVHHAYLFSGPRGIGKTSLARILAKSLNCSEGPTPTPCGKCRNCVEITKGQSLDIIEIDAASNRGIEEIRSLRESVKLSTASARYKIYIIDEVHMLTPEAFNALLKTLEEPPPHVKFIFATTHPHKVLPTILSRCQKFQFNLISLENIVAKLKKIIKNEEIDIEENLLYTIGRAAGGSIRDAESLLDQLVPVVLEEGCLEDVFSFLGIIDEESLNRALKALVEKNLSFCLDFIDKLLKDGKDLGIFLNAFIEHLRNLLLAKVSTSTFKKLSDISPQSKEAICALSPQVTTADILRIIDSLIAAKEVSQRLNTVRIPLELALIKYCYQEAPSNIATSSLKKTNHNPTQNRNEFLQADFTDISDLDFEIDNISTAEDALQKENFDQSQKSQDATDIQESQIQKDNAFLQPLVLKWQEFISQMQAKRAALAAHLSCARPLFSQGRLITIAFSPADSFHQEIVENAKNQKFIEGAISKFIGQTVKIRFVTQELSAQSSQQDFQDASEERKHNADQSTDEEISGQGEDADKEQAFLDELLDTFGGKFQAEE